MSISLAIFSGCYAIVLNVFYTRSFTNHCLSVYRCVCTCIHCIDVCLSRCMSALLSVRIAFFLAALLSANLVLCLHLCMYVCIAVLYINACIAYYSFLCKYVFPSVCLIVICLFDSLLL